MYRYDTGDVTGHTSYSASAYRLYTPNKVVMHIRSVVSVLEPLLEIVECRLKDACQIWQKSD